MSPPRHCPRCQREMASTGPQQVCPACLLRDLVDPVSESELAVDSNHHLQTPFESEDLPHNESNPVVPDVKGQRVPPRTLFGDYELIREIARGGMGIVFEARQISLQRTVAVKLLLHGRFSSPEQIHRFQAEAAAAARLQHPHIVRIHDVGEFEGQPFFSMDFIAGKNLTELVRLQPLPPREAAQWIHTVALAVHYAHDNGIVHRDLKPSNILIDAFGHPRITDFGLARDLDIDDRLTLTGEVLGSPSFASPEQAAGHREEIGKPTDIYSLGAMLYHVITGRPPFMAESVATTLDQVRHADPPPPISLNPAIPRDLNTICLKCLSKAPSQRYISAQALADDLHRFLNHEPILARPATRRERLLRWTRRKPAAAALFALAALFLFSLTGGALIYGRQKESARATEQARRQEAEEARYVADVRLTQNALDLGQLGLARQLLAGLTPLPDRPDLCGVEWHILAHRAKAQNTRIAWQQSDPILAAALSSDGKILAIAEEARLRLLNLHTNTPTTELASLNLPRITRNRSLTFSSDSQTVWIGDSSGLHEVTLSPLSIRQLSDLPVTRFAVTADDSRIALSHYEDSGRVSALPIRIWNRPAAQFETVLPHGGGPALRWLPDNESLLTVGRDGTVWQWHIPSGKIELLSPGHELHHSACISPDLQWAALVSQSGRFRLVNLARRHIAHHTDGVAGRDLRLCFNHNATQVAMAGPADQRVHVLLSPTLEHSHAWLGHEEQISEIVALPSPDDSSDSNNSRYLTASVDGTVRIWSTPPTSLGIRLPGPRRYHPPQHLLFSSDSSLIALPETSDSNVDKSAVWQVGQWSEPRTRLSGIPLLMHASTERSDGLPGILTWKSGGHFTWHATPLSSIKAQEFVLPALADAAHMTISESGRWIAWIDSSRRAHLFDLNDGSHQSGPNLPTYQAKFAPVDPPVLILSLHDSIAAWEPTTIDPETLLAVDSDEFAFAPDDRTIAIGDWFGRIHLLDFTSRQVMGMFRGHSGGVLALAFSPDGRTLVSGSEDRTIRFWNMPTRKEVAVFSRNAIPRSLAFSPDGKWLLIGEEDAHELWPAPTANIAPDPIRQQSATPKGPQFDPILRLVEHSTPNE